MTGEMSSYEERVEPILVTGHASKSEEAADFGHEPPQRQPTISHATLSGADIAEVSEARSHSGQVTEAFSSGQSDGPVIPPGPIRPNDVGAAGQDESPLGLAVKVSQSLGSAHTTAVSDDSGKEENTLPPANEPLFWSDPPGFPTRANDKRPHAMTYKFLPINHDTETRLFRMKFSHDVFAIVEGSLEIFPWDKHPPFTCISNSAAFSTDEVSWILIDGEPFPVTKGFEFFLRGLRTVNGRNSTDDTILYALVLCEDVADNRTSVHRAMKQCRQTADAPQNVNSWPDELLHMLTQREDTFGDQTVKLPHPRQPDGGTWAGTKNVTIHGQSIEISQNLHDFLMEAIETGKEADRQGQIFSRYIIYWIDAICINQKDDREKIYQIKRMHDIYANALLVLVWLGHGDLDFFQQINISLRQGHSQPTEDDLMYRARNNIKLMDNYEVCGVLMDTFARPFFTRAWTTQELVAAKKILVRCGRDHVPWDILATMSPVHTDVPAFIPLLDYHPASREDKMAFMRGICFSRAGLVGRVKARRAAGKPVTLLSLLLATLNMKSTLAKDKIYSLWSIADDIRELVGEPDYSQSDAKLYTSLMVGWVEKYRRMDILSVRALPSSRVTTGCPSWAIDWNDSVRVFRPFVSAFPSGIREDAIDDVENDRVYDASKGVDHVLFLRMAIAPPSDTIARNQPPSLITAGLSCDTIAYVTEMHNRWILDPEWLELADEDDLFAAITAGRSPDGKKMKPEDPRKYFEWPELGDDAETFANFRSGRLPNWNRDKSKSSDEYFEMPENSEQYFENITWRQHIQNNIFGRKLAVTEGGHIGLVPGLAPVGDEIAIVFDCSVPLVFRRIRLGQKLILGDAYFHRMMDGEMIELAGGGTHCLAEMYICVERERDLRLAQQALHEHVTRKQAPDAVSAGQSGAQANVAQVTAQDATNSTDGEGKGRSTGNFHDSRTTFKAGLGEDLWCDDLNGSMLDVVNATVRDRKPGDEGVWVQLFLFPGGPGVM